MTAFSHQPRLWFTAQDVQRVRQRISEGEATACALRDRAVEGASKPVDQVITSAFDEHGQRVLREGEAYVAANTAAYLATGDARYAQQGLAAFLAWVKPWSPSDLRLAANAHLGAMMHELCYEAWSFEQRLEMSSTLHTIVQGMKDVRQGNPHSVMNNWWAVTHSGALVAAMAIHGHPSDAEDGRFDMTEDIAWCRGRLSAFCSHFGDQAVYHEGLGYQGYTCGNLLPALLALKGFDGTDLLEKYPNLRRMAASLYLSVAMRSPISDSELKAATIGSKLSWNDDGQGWYQGSLPVVMMHMAPQSQQGALRWMYDRLGGIHGDGQFGGAAAWALTLRYYPYDIPPVNPEGILPRQVNDSRQGLVMLRDRFKDGEDAILGVYARTTHIGGHSQDDAGSIRFMALGHDWILGGGQARGDAAWQSIAFRADQPRPKPTPCGAILWEEARSHGGIVGVELRKASEGYHERYVAADFSGAAGTPAVLAVLDQIDDHLQQAWLWNMTFAPHLAMTVHDDQLGFTLAATDGASMQARFLGSRPESISLTRTPDSQRTFSGGHTVHYPGRPVVSARFAPAPHLGIYAIMTVQRGPAPKVELKRGLDVRIGDHTWIRPMGAAVPAAFRLGVSGGLCRCPAGVTGPSALTPT